MAKNSPKKNDDAATPPAEGAAPAADDAKDTITPPAVKTLDNTTADEARANVPDVAIVGNGDAWQLLCKASSKREGWMKSTTAFAIPYLGCLVQVTTQQGDQIAEAVTFVPGVRIAPDDCGGRTLVPLKG